MTKPLKQYRVAVDFSERERTLLDALCEADLRPAAEQIRWLVQNETKRRGVETPHLAVNRQALDAIAREFNDRCDDLAATAQGNATYPGWADDREEVLRNLDAHLNTLSYAMCVLTELQDLRRDTAALAAEFGP